MRPIHTLGALALLAAAAIGTQALPAGAQSATTLTFKELDRGSTFRVVDAPPRMKGGGPPRFSIGDSLVISSPTAKSASAGAGRLSADCRITVARKGKSPLALCDGAYAFANGTIYVTGLIPFDGANGGIVIGGSGDYAGAEGSFVSRDVKGGSQTTVTLAP
jgi:hypothetical protein